MNIRYFRVWEDRGAEEFIIPVNNLSINKKYINSISAQNDLAFIRVSEKERLLINFEKLRGFSKYCFIADEEYLPEGFFFGDFLIPGQSGILVKDNLMPISVISAPESLFKLNQSKISWIDDSSTLGKILKMYGKDQNLIIDYD